MKQVRRWILLLAAVCMLVVVVPTAAAAGRYEITYFNAQMGTIAVTAEEECTLAVAMYSADGQLLWVDTQPVEGEEVLTAELPAEQPEGCTFDVFLLDPDTWEPLCPSASQGGGTEKNYAVTELTADGETIIANVSTADACTVVVEVLTEDLTQVLSSRTAAAGELLELQDVAVEGFGTLPAYFALRGRLVDENGEDLCAPYVTIRYTKAYEKFEARTPEDFPDSIVLDFGSNGFGVLVDHAIAMQSTAVALTEDRSAFTFAASELPKVGDVLVLTEEDGLQTPMKVGTVTNNGDGTVTVMQDANTAIADLYQVLKLNASIDMGKAIEENGKVLLQGEDKPQVDKELDLFKINQGFEAGPLGINVTGTISAVVKAFYDKELFGEDYYEFETYTQTEVEATVSLSGGFSKDSFKDAFGRPLLSDLTIYKGPIALIGCGMLAVQLEISVPWDVEAEAGGKITASIQSKSGTKSNGIGEPQKIESKEASGSLEIYGKVEAKIGVEIAMSIQVLGPVFEGEVSFDTGVGVVAEQSRTITDITDGPKNHACKVCLDADFYAYYGGHASLKLLPCTKVELTFAEVDFLNGRHSLGMAYCSVVNDPDSLFEGKLHFGWGNCPNYKYRVITSTVDAEGETISGVPVIIEGVNGAQGVSPYMTYLYDGTYVAAADFDSGTAKETFQIYRAEKQITVEEKETRIEGYVTDSDTGRPLADVRVRVERDGNAWTTSSDSDGKYAMKLQPGTYTMTLEKDAYKTRSISVSLDGGKTTVVNVSIYPETVKVRFEANGGSGAMEEQSLSYGESFKLPECGFEPPEGMFFVCWSIDGVFYDPASWYECAVSDLSVIPVWSDGTYSVTVKFEHVDGTPVSGAKILGLDQQDSYAYNMDESGTITKDLSAGRYTIMCWTDSVFASETIVVTGETEVTLAAETPSLSWSFDEATETLYVTGNGPMPDYSLHTAPWNDYYPITKVIRVSGVLTIGDWAFNNFYKTTKVELSNDLLAIGSCAFIHCYDLQTVNIPDSVRWLGWGSTTLGAFENCTALTNITIPEGVTYIGDACFRNTGLVSITVPSTTKYLGYGAFACSNSLKSVIIQDGLTEIGNCAFEFCEKLSTVILPDSIIKIGNSAFVDCDSLASISLPARLETIGQAVFNGCDLLSKIEIPETVTSIGGSAFNGCSELKTVVFTSQTPPAASYETFYETEATVYYPNTWQSVPTMGKNLIYISYDPAVSEF